ncbi:hypothetical protein Tco_0498673 [Tanacetum coccineum]
MDSQGFCSFTSDASNQGLCCYSFKEAKVIVSGHYDKDEAHALRYLVHSGADKTYYDLRDMYGGHAEVGESGLTRPSWYKRQPTRIEVGDKVMLEVSSWKDVVHFGKKEMLAPRYVGPFKYLADTNLHVHLEEIKVDKTLHFVKEPVEIIDHKVKSLKRSRILIVKSIGTRSEVMRISYKTKYPHLLVEQAIIGSTK